jgi:hypothetical protein
MAGRRRASVRVDHDAPMAQWAAGVTWNGIDGGSMPLDAL